MTQSGCPHCNGTSIVVEPAEMFARARLCSCVPPCERCRGTGRVTVTREGVDKIARCRCRMLPDRIVMFNAANIPARHAHASFESFNKDLPETMNAFLGSYRWTTRFSPKASNRSLVLHGPVGRGKTHLLISVVRELIFKHGVQVRFVEFSKLLADLKHGFEMGKGQSHTMGPLSRVEVLAIDELGKGRNTEWERNIVDELVSIRYNGLKCLVATTNYTTGGPTGLDNNLSSGQVQSLTDRVGPRVYSRLTEMADFVEAKGADYRATHLRGQG